MPEGWFLQKEKVSKRANTGFAFLLALTFLLFLWLAVNAPLETTKVAGKEVIKAGGLRWRWLGIIYAVMGGITMAIIGIDWVEPKKLTSATQCMSGPGDWTVLECIVIGIAIAGGVMLVSSFAFATAGTMPFALEVFPKTPLINWAIVGFSIPIIEEASFGMMLSSSFTENYGLLTGLTVPSFIFAIFHWGVYGLTPSLLLPLFLFRSLATLSMVFSRSWLPGVVGHILVNTGSVMAVY